MGESRRFAIIVSALSVGILFIIYSVIPIWAQPSKHEESAQTSALLENPAIVVTVPTTSSIAIRTSTEPGPNPAETLSIEPATRHADTITPATVIVEPTNIAASTNTSSTTNTTLPPLQQFSRYLKSRITPTWHGWGNITELLVFGDSYSSTGFNLSSDLPSTSNPLGNPAYPGMTVTNGENWIDLLTETYNASTILTADFAVGGATIDSHLIKPEFPEELMISFKQQVQEFENRTVVDWTPDTSLFVVWFGVNDITASTDKTRNNFEAEFVEYAQFLQRLGRNFLILNAPPINRAPIARLEEHSDWPEIIQHWNANVTALAEKLNATTLLFDVWQLYTDVIEEPCIFEETCGFKSVDDACQGYYYGGPPGQKNPDCPYSIDEYLWINTLHPSTRMHNATAKAVSDALKALGAD